MKSTTTLEARARKRRLEAGELAQLRMRLKDLVAENGRLRELVRIYEDKETRRSVGL